MENIFGNDIQIVRANSIEECKEAMNISLNSFYPDRINDKQKSDWEFKWFSDPSFEPKMVLLSKIKGKIVGGLRTKKIIINRESQEFNCLGICEIFTSVETRGMGMAGKLVDFAIKISEKEEYDLILGVARKNIDGFYLKYSFYGIGSYSKIIMKNINFSYNLNPEDSEKYTFKNQHYNPKLNEFYKETYSKLFGSFFRHEDDWKYVLEFLNSNSNNLMGIYEDKNLVGYLIHSDKVIKELSYNKSVNVRKMIFDLSDFLKSDEIHFNLSTSHPLLFIDSGYDMSVNSRECFYGGHIARITNINSVVRKFIIREEERLALFKSNINSYKIDNFLFDLDRNEIVINDVKNTNSKIHKIWGTASFQYPISYELTKTLLGIKSQYKTYETTSSPFSLIPFNISNIDEF